MNMRVEKPEGGKDYIWLRYATEFIVEGRKQSVEMGIPVPLGATAEAREQLFREAEEGMEQLIAHVEQRLPLFLQEKQTAPAIPARASRAIQSQPPAAKPASEAAPQTVQLPATEPEKPMPPRPERRATTPPSPRSSSGISMPTVAAGPSEGVANMSLPEFLHVAQEELNLKPRDILNLLGLRTLQGVNYRQALQQLRMVQAHKNGENSAGRQAEPERRQSAPQARILREQGAEEIAIEQKKTEALERPSAPLRFAEETEPEEEEEIFFDEEEDEPYSEDEEEEEIGPPPATSDPVERAHYRLRRLRAVRGREAPSADRWRAFQNLILSSLSEQQVMTLVRGVWSIDSPRKLKAEQCEELISWAKEDNFPAEAEALIQLLEEEHYARGNW
uniref:Uncharacterized protein n=1 Tax=Thermosporothrix sp. COM3 TaxID=2490863 RepID=A0A455SM28_9CHLR|nr:hypothetical protein KTC_42340 [Thermosporothrix sp. COM3]